MHSNLLSCHNSGWIQGKGITYYSYRNESHLFIWNSCYFSKAKLDTTATATLSLLPFHSFYFRTVLPSLFILIHKQKIMQWHLKNITHRFSHISVADWEESCTSLLHVQKFRLCNTLTMFIKCPLKDIIIKYLSKIQIHPSIYDQNYFFKKNILSVLWNSSFCKAYFARSHLAKYN